jgi:monomeric isocitrate dehydrogenase
MKVSDPKIFGHCVKAFFKPLFAKHGPALQQLGVDVNNGFGDLVSRLHRLPAADRTMIEAAIQVTVVTVASTVSALTAASALTVVSALPADPADPAVSGMLRRWAGTGAGGLG